MKAAATGKTAAVTVTSIFPTSKMANLARAIITALLLPPLPLPLASLIVPQITPTMTRKKRKRDQCLVCLTSARKTKPSEKRALWLRLRARKVLITAPARQVRKRKVVQQERVMRNQSMSQKRKMKVIFIVFMFLFWGLV